MYRLALSQPVDRHSKKDASQKMLLPAKEREVTEDEERIKVSLCHAGVGHIAEDNKQRKELWRDAAVRHSGLPARPTLFTLRLQAASPVYLLLSSTHLRFLSHPLPTGSQTLYSLCNRRIIRLACAPEEVLCLLPSFSLQQALMGLWRVTAQV